MSLSHLLAAAACAVGLSAAAEPLPVVMTPEATTLEHNILLTFYDWLKPHAAAAYRLEFPAADGETRVGHWQIPAGPGPHPTVVVFPIRAGTHVVSEGVAKALVTRGYAAVWLEKRRSLFGEDDHRSPGDFASFAADLGDFVTDGRRLIAWLAARPEVDPERIATAGVSLGGVLAATTLAQEPLVRAGFFVMAGGGLAEMLRDSQDPDLVEFRRRGIEAKAFADGADLVRQARPYTDPMDPLTYAQRIQPGQVLLISARFDRVIGEDRTRALWEAFGRPRWLAVPTGHYQLVPYFWWAIGRGADHLDRVFGRPARGAQARVE